jgi:hypothetical protein
MNVAMDEGAISAPAAEGPPKEPEKEAEDQPAPSPEETSTETPAEGQEEEETDAAKSPSEWPGSAKTRVAVETDKRRRANDRADRAEADLVKAQQKVQELERTISRVSGPTPTRDNSMIDIQDVGELDAIERVYDDLLEVDPTQVDEQGNVPIIVSRKADGSPVWQALPPDTVTLLQKRAERALRKDVPQRRKYLETRSVEDAKAIALYPELENREAEFSQIAAYLANKVINGGAQSDPELLQWIGHAVYGFRKRMEELRATNGQASASGVKRMAESAKTRLAPSAPKTRASAPVQRSVERAEVAKAEQQFAKSKSVEDAEAYVGALLSQRRGSHRRIEPLAE